MSVQWTPEIDDDPVSAEVLQWFVGAEDDSAVVGVIGEVDLSTAATLGRVLQLAIDDRPPKLIVDLAQVRFLDSSGIQCLVAASRVAATVDCTLVVRNPNPSIARVFSICGVDELLMERSIAQERSDGAAPKGR